MTHHTDASLLAFIARWHASGAAERANYQLFLAELCTVLDVPAPDPTAPVEADNAYVFEKASLAPRHDRPHRSLPPRLLCAGGQAGQRPARAG